MYIYVKRVMDILLVLALSPLWLPLGVVLILLIKVSSKGPVFFKQKRYGQNREFFMIYKFRSMYVDAPKDVPTHLLLNPMAFITPVGRFLRKFSLDELPQVINIIKGELSVVGPRPALWNQDDLIAEREKYGANAVPVGLTGLAQVRGRDELPINIKAAYDGEYAQRMGFFLDVKILFATIISAVLGRGVMEGGPQK
ncbi:MAG: sugar transferase [Defluviitaleaceae bacterium]|nr:sugar transferase [Defluviitaleaceae bacterium]